MHSPIRRMLLDPSMWLFLPLGAAMLCTLALLVARSKFAVRVSGSFAMGCLALGMAGTAFWSWLLRDGMGPAAVQSHGGIAWLRFWEGFWFRLLCAALAGMVVVAAWRWRGRRVGPVEIDSAPARGRSGEGRTRGRRTTA